MTTYARGCLMSGNPAYISIRIHCSAASKNRTSKAKGTGLGSLLPASTALDQRPDNALRNSALLSIELTVLTTASDSTS